MLLDAGADITIVDENGAKPLAVASFCGQKAVVELLLNITAKVFFFLSYVNIIRTKLLF